MGVPAVLCASGAQERFGVEGGERGTAGTSHRTGACLGSAVASHAPGNPIQAQASARATRQRALAGLMVSILS